MLCSLHYRLLTCRGANVKSARINYHAVLIGYSGGLTLLLGGCASVPPPKEDLALAENSVQAAEEAGALEHAPLELRRAKQKLEKAEVAMEAEDYRVARRYLEQAHVDAQVAELKARSAKAQIAVQELQKSLRLLREQMEPSQTEQF